MSRRIRPRLISRRHVAAQRSLQSLLRAFVWEEDGQDVIEYGLLSLFIGIATLAVWASIQGHLRDAYVGYDADTQNLWQSPDPGGS